MKDSQNILDDVHDFFPMDAKDIRTYSPLKLAYLGDAVYEIMIRTLIIERTGGPVKKLHTKASTLVNAKAQSDLAAAMQDSLTEEERAAFRHGRNAKTSSVAKHADIHDYRNATGLEALFGYLYLMGQSRRAIELLKIAMDKQNILL